MKTISEKFYKNQGNQSQMYILIVKLPDDTKLKVSIRKNAYDFQSHCKLYRWDGEKWQFMVSTPYTEMLAVNKEPYYELKQNIKSYQEDAKKLIKEAKEVIG